MGPKSEEGKVDSSLIKIVSAFVLIVLIAAAVIIAEQKAREPYVVRGKAKMLALTAAEVGEGFKTTLSVRDPYKTSDGWRNGFVRKDERLIKTNVFSTVYVYPFIEDAEKEFDVYVDGILNKEYLDETPFERIGDRSFFHTKIIVVAERNIPYYELMFRKANVIAYTEFFVEDRDFNNTALAHDTIKRLSEATLAKIGTG